MALAGISSVGVKFGYAVETEAGVQPTVFNLLTRINQIGGISIDTESIDASALEDEIEKMIAGRGSTGGTFDVTVNLTDDTVAEWQALITAYKAAKAAGKGVWFQTWFPNLENGFFVVAEPPTIIPQPEVDQNGLVTTAMKLTINDYKGMLKKIDMAAAA